ncbi:hypothetical protein AURDEDRAFT_152871 [Auricularia subglabra TFB-10046 SS5]|nr:hypothetical protein AURDEDRAFT_152871 [Auricularia subglabra TFB-10046 SS5]
MMRRRRRRNGSSHARVKAWKRNVGDGGSDTAGLAKRDHEGDSPLEKDHSADSSKLRASTPMAGSGRSASWTTHGQTEQSSLEGVRKGISSKRERQHWLERKQSGDALHVLRAQKHPDLPHCAARLCTFSPSCCTRTRQWRRFDLGLQATQRRHPHQHPQALRATGSRCKGIAARLWVSRRPGVISADDAVPHRDLLVLKMSVKVGRIGKAGHLGMCSDMRNEWGGLLDGEWIERREPDIIVFGFRELIDLLDRKLTANVRHGPEHGEARPGRSVWEQARFLIDDSSVCVVNCHLAAGQKKHVKSGNTDVAAILEHRTAFSPIGGVDEWDVSYVGGDRDHVLRGEEYAQQGCIWLSQRARPDAA